jgi:putative transposase
MYRIIHELAYKSKNVYNLANYFIRQEFIKNKKWIRYNELDKIMQQHDCYYELGSQCSQQILRVLDKNWMSFFKAIKDWNKNKHKYLGRPKLPKYKNKESGRNLIILSNIMFKVIDSKLKISWKPLNKLTVNSKITRKPMQLRIIPKGSNYVLEIVYEVECDDLKPDNKKYIGIDLGVNNFATVVNNTGLKPFIINGKIIKSINQYYNKKLAEIKSELKLKNNKHWSNKLDRLNIKRYNKIKNYMHKSSKYIINYCLNNNINTIVIGKNNKWKQNVKIGKKNNQNFVGVPYEVFINQVIYKAEFYGINVIKTKESYTSGTSFLDNEKPVKKNYDISRRIKRGLFQSNKGILINSDINGAYQIIKKAFPKTFVDGIEGIDLYPVKLNLI